MLETIKFLLQLALQLAAKLFTINVGFTSLGVLLCTVYILFPVMLAIINSLKQQIVSDISDEYVASRRKDERRSKK